MTTFIHNVADELLRRFGWEGLKDVTLVFPMHRAGVVMRSELQRRMATEHPSAVWAPQIMALGDLFDSLCPLGKEDELFTVCRLHRIYSECLEGEPMDIDRFYGWGRQLLSDFTNIDQGISEAEIDSFFRNSLALSDLDRYKLDEEVRHRLVDLLYKGDARRQEAIAESVQAHFAALWHALPDIYHRLRDELQQAGKGYDGQRMRYVISHWQQLSQRAESRMYCFIGFNYLLPVERQLMQLLKDEERALFFWDYVEDFRTNTKAFAFIRQNIRSLPNALPAATWGQPRKIKTITATSVHSEAEYAGQWLQQTYRQHGEQTAVVICDESQLEPVIYSLPAIRLDGSDTPEQVNITKGYPLRHAPVYVAVIKALDKSFRNHPGDCISALQEVVMAVDGLSKQSLQLKQDTWQWHMERESLYQTRRALLQFITILRDQTVQTLAGQPDLLRRLIMRHMEQITLPFHGEPTRLDGVVTVKAGGAPKTFRLDDAWRAENTPFTPCPKRSVVRRVEASLANVQIVDAKPGASVEFSPVFVRTQRHRRPYFFYVFHAEKGRKVHFEAFAAGTGTKGVKGRIMVCPFGEESRHVWAKPLKGDILPKVGAMLRCPRPYVLSIRYGR